MKSIVTCPSNFIDLCIKSFLNKFYTPRVIVKNAHKRTQQTFVLMKTSWRRLSTSSSDDTFKIPSRRLQQDEYIRLSHALSEDVFKTSWSRPIISSWPYVFTKSSRRFQDIFKTSSRRLQNDFKTSCKNVFKVNRTSVMQKQLSEGFFKKRFMRNFAEFTKKHLCRKLFFDKVKLCRSATSLKMSF